MLPVRGCAIITSVRLMMASTVQTILAGNKQHFTHIPSTSRSSRLKITPRPRACRARMIATIVSELSIFEQTRVFRSGSLFRGGFDDIVSGVSVFVTTVQLSEFACQNSTMSTQIHGSGKVLVVPGDQETQGRLENLIILCYDVASPQKSGN